jgi:hypothetical protein
MRHCPAPSICIVFPPTIVATLGSELEKVTVSPELADAYAAIEKSGLVYVLTGSVLKVIV